MDDDDFGTLLDDTAGPAPLPTLEAVVHRAERRVWTIVAVGALTAVVAAMGAGLVVAHTAGGHASTLTETAAGPADSAGQAGVASSAAALLPGKNLKLESLFTRTTADGITVRAYQVDPGPVTAPPASTPAAKIPACAPPAAPFLRVELSDAAAVDLAGGPSFADGASDKDDLALVSAGGFGTAEGGPAGWVAVKATGKVASVRLDGPSASDKAWDAMAPVKGYAVLAHTGDLSKATVVALDSAGATVATLSAVPDKTTAPKPCVGLVPPCLAKPKPAGATGAATTAATPVPPCQAFVCKAAGPNQATADPTCPVPPACRFAPADASAAPTTANGQAVKRCPVVEMLPGGPPTSGANGANTQDTVGHGPGPQG